MSDDCYSPIAIHEGGMMVGKPIWTCDGYELVGAGEACEPQCCAGHRWTICYDCGRNGDRAGDETVNACTPP